MRMPEVSARAAWPAPGRWAGQRGGRRALLGVLSQGAERRHAHRLPTGCPHAPPGHTRPGLGGTTGQPRRGAREFNGRAPALSVRSVERGRVENGCHDNHLPPPCVCASRAPGEAARGERSGRGARCPVAASAGALGPDPSSQPLCLGLGLEPEVWIYLPFRPGR